ncbi:MAG: glycosyltransferase family 4 protein [Pirellulaceae bacterium]
MSWVYLTAGAAGMFCGSCMNDNALAKALIRQGQDCLLVPVYTPIRTDESDASSGEIFFGGIQVYLQQKFPWLPPLPKMLIRRLNQPGLINRLAGRTHSIDLRFLGAMTVSMLEGESGKQRQEVARLTEWLASEAKPSALILTNFLIAGALPSIKRQIDVPVVVMLQGDDIFIDSLPEPYRSRTVDRMRKLIPLVDAFVVHSEDYGQRMAELLGLPRDRWHCLPLGIDLDSQPMAKWEASPPSNPSKEEPFRVLYLARLAPEKGLHQLADAWRRWNATGDPTPRHLDIAGWLGGQHQRYWDEIARSLNASSPAGFTYHGSVDREVKLRLLANADLLCVPTVYREPKGRYVLEAAAAGLPYLLPAHGAFPEMHRRLQHGALYSPGDPEALLSGLQEACQRSATMRRDRAAAQKRLRDQIGIDQHATLLIQLVAGLGSGRG